VKKTRFETMADLNLQAVHDEMVSTAYAAGEMMLAANPGELDTDTKLNCAWAA
jgi:myo-inositol-1(or 4)-monophosphatase